MPIAEPDWTQAKCRLHDPELFFPQSGRANKKQRLAAKAVCRGTNDRVECPVREACRDNAVVGLTLSEGEQREITGIWGGLSERERRAFARTGLDPVNAGREVAKDEGLPARDQGGDKGRRANRKNAAGGGRRSKSGAKATGRPARKRASQARVLPTRRLPTNHGCATARGVGEDAVAGDLRGRPRRSREVAAMGATARSAIRAVALRSMRVAVDGDVA